MNSAEQEKIETLVSLAGEYLQEIQNSCGREQLPCAKVRFPRGFINTASNAKQSIPAIGTEVQRKNASYELLKLDVYRWLVIRTDLKGAALSMVVKDAIATLGNLCDWLTKEAIRGHGSKKSFIDRIDRLTQLGQINNRLASELKWVWGMRNRTHFYGIDDSLEYKAYKTTDYNRALKAYSELRDGLVETYGPAE